MTWVEKVLASDAAKAQPAWARKLVEAAGGTVPPGWEEEEEDANRSGD